MLKRIGHVDERGDGARKQINRAGFFRAWVEWSPEEKGEATSRLEAAKLAHAEAQAQKTEIELAKLRGELIEVEQVNRDFQVFTGAVRGYVENAAKMFGPKARQLFLDMLGTLANEFGVEEINGRPVKAKKKPAKRKRAATKNKAKFPKRPRAIR